MIIDDHIQFLGSQFLEIAIISWLDLEPFE